MLDALPTTLLPGQVSLLACKPEDIELPAHQVRYLAMLSPEEQDRWSRLGSASVRDTFLIARALLRTGLSHYARPHPQDWRFITGPQGKPAIHPEQNPSLCALHFNLSHTRQLIVCAITQGCEVGVDVEYTERRSRLEPIARRFFSDPEVAQLHGLDEAQFRSTFFRFWTLKEAYLKARGTGITLPLDKFGFDLEADLPPQVWFAPALQDRAEDWCFTDRTIGHHHRLALALHRPYTESQALDAELTTQFIIP